MVIYLRRIEFGFPLEIQCEMLDYINAEEISLTTVIGIIQKTIILHRKREIKEGFVRLLYMNMTGCSEG